MKIRTKIAFQFSLIVALILILFSVALYFLIRNYTKGEFTNYLKDRAETTAKLLIKEANVDKRLLKIVDKNTLSTLYAAEVLVFNEKNEIAYSNTDAETIKYSPDLLERIREQGEYVGEYKEKKVVGLVIPNELDGKIYLILAQATDTYGDAKLENIQNAMIWGLVIAITLTVILSFFFAGEALKPIARINQEVSAISGRDFKKKISTGNNRDEIAQLATNFNQMLSRIDQAFEMQRSFVSNASHELRTPLAAIKSEIQVALEKDREPEEYRQILHSLDQDNQRMIQLINGLLQLAKSEQGDTNLMHKPVRVDEVLFEVQEELLSQFDDFSIFIDFEEIVEEDENLTVLGNRALLKTLFNNLFENACKYSSNRTAEVRIKFNKVNVIVSIKDTGLGISAEDQERVFEPFYRTASAANYKGHGIGLSICKRIADIHKGKIVVRSELGVGSTFIVVLPHIS
ncbi:sensor histidine kinase [Leadbetterella byssophila]|uniref:histidine kinase n=1 Tax=Leadbetterella byssophila (strain DSM 17132 / JCM 16389 / KACC 11308 / NBRC 106382 / 4M15) TaxID=649349 RepID=E4RSZ0_LEAB4|nr:HAMP domain-containing sensor histidine kinase [Leadbetterella byssophila]ADQ16829.1 integral membrane sensor signal transduction histidine kinase [Leadbetterella byssophila DSM 17132]